MTRVQCAVYAAVYGDIVGSSTESKDKLFRDESLSVEDLEKKGCFTDDTVLTVATYDALKNKKDFFSTYIEWASKYRRAGYGSNFRENILTGKVKAFESHGSSNGCIMRASSLLELDFNKDIETIKSSILCTHNHPDSLLAYEWYDGFAKGDELPISYIDYEDLLEVHSFDITALGTVRDAISVAVASCSIREAAMKASFLGGDTDTVAAIACSLVAYKTNDVDSKILDFVNSKITGEMRDLLSS